MSNTSLPRILSLFVVINIAGYGVALGSGLLKWLIQTRQYTLAGIALEDHITLGLMGLGFSLVILNGLAWVKLSRAMAQREQSQAALVENETRYRHIMENLQDVIYPYDRAGSLLYVNSAYESLTGRSVQSVYERPESWKEAIHPGDAPRVGAGLGNGTDKNFEKEYRVVRPDGTIRWVRNRVFPIHDADGQVYRLCGIAQDITARKQAEEALAESEQKFRQVIAQSNDAIILVDETGCLIEWNPATERISGLKQSDVVGSTLWDSLYRFIPAQQQTPERYEQLKSEWLAYFQTGQHPSLNQIFEWEIQQPDGSRRMMQTARFSIKTERGYLLSSIIRDVTEQKQMEAKLRESEARFHTMFTNHAAVMLLVEPSTGQIIEANLAAARFYGYPVSQLCMMNIADLNMLPPDQIQSERQKALAEKDNVFVFPHRLATGEIRTVEVHSSPIFLANQAILFSIIHDITEREQAEAALRESEARFATIFRASPLSTSLLRLKDQLFIDVNQAFITQSGFSREEIIGRTPFEINLWVNLDQRAQMLKKLREQGSLHGFEVQVYDKSGAVVDLLMSAELIEVGGEPCLLTLAQDITKRKQAEEILREREQFIESILSATPNLIFIYTLTEQRLTFSNRQFAAVLGCGEIKGILNPLVLSDYLHPEDVERYQAHLAELQLGQAGEILTLEYRLREKEGDWRWVQSYETVFKRDPSGQPLEVLGIAHDITARKEIEAILKQERTYLRQVIDAVPGHICVKNREGRFILANQAVANAYKTSVGNLIGRTDADFNPNRAEVAAYLANDHDTLDSGQVHFIAEEPVTYADGQVHWHATYKVPLLDGQNHPSQVLVVSTDITAQKQAQEQLRFQARLLDVVGQAVTATDPNGLIFYWNQAATTLYGWSAEEVLGRDALQLLTPALPQGQADDILTSLAKQGVWQGELLVNRRDNSTLPVFVTVTTFSDTQGKIAGLMSVSADISERKAMEAALQASYAQYQSVVDNIKEVIFQGDTDGQWTFLNPAWTEITGFSLAESLGQNYLDFIYPDDRAHLLELLQPLIERKQEYCRLQIRYLVKPGSQQSQQTGEFCWMEVHARLTRDRDGNASGSTGTLRDITELKRAEEAIQRLNAELEDRVRQRTTELFKTNQRLELEVIERRQAQAALQESEQRYRRIVETAQEGIVNLDPEGHIVLLNQRMADMLGYSIGEMIGQPVFAFMDETSRAIAAAKLERRRQGIREQFDLKFRRNDGTDLWAIVSTAPWLNPDGTYAGALSMLTDISEHKQLQANLQRRALQLQAAAEIARDITALPDLEQLLDRAVKLVRDRFGFGHAGIFLLDEGGEYAVLRAATNHIEQTMLREEHRLKVGQEGIVGCVTGSGEPLLVLDVEAEPAHFKHPLLPQTRSEMALPLKIEERIIGALDVQSEMVAAFRDDDVIALQTMADQLAIAIENTRLYAETHQRAHQLTVLHELDRAITTSLYFDDVYAAFAQHTARLLTYDRMSITLREGDFMRVAYVAGKQKTALTVGTSLPLKSSWVGLVVRQGQILLRHHISADVRFAEDEFLTAAGLESMMMIPLRTKGQVVGTWNISSCQIGAYQPDDLALAQTMADQLAIALENARLYEAEREQFRRLQQSQAQLIRVEKMAALGRLIASIAHEINNPLQAVRSSLTLVQEELAEFVEPRPPQTAIMKQFLDIAEGEIERISALVRNMRDFYRPTRQNESEQTITPDSLDHFYRSHPTELQSLDLVPILESVLILTNKQLQHKKIKVEQNWPADLPLIRGNPNHLKQVFLNLTLNAMDAMTPQGGVLYIRAGLTGSDMPPMVAIEFEDTGVGIVPEVLERLFEPLFTTKEQGSGLGLFTSYKIIEAHHGQIKATSQPRQGTCFTILLPALASV